MASLAPLSAIAAAPHPSARHVVFERPVRQESSALPGGQRGRLQIRQLADSALAVAAASPRQQLPANPVVAASWTPLGPAPERGLTTLCSSPPNTATCGSYGNSSGRITSVVTDPANALIAYAGSAGGGVWKTTDGGKNWVPLTDTQASLAIGSLALDPTNGQVIYAGTGEENSAESQGGQGILKSTDGGSTWTLLGQAQFAGRHIGSIVVDRSNSAHVMAAGDMGLWNSLDAGATWTKFTAYVSRIFNPPGSTPSGALFQVIQDPDAAGKFWLSVGDNCASEVGDLITGDGTDNPANWVNVTPVTFTQATSRISLAVGHGDVAYVAAAGCYGNLIDISKTTNGAVGSSWTQIYAANESRPTANPPTPPATTKPAPGVFNYFNSGGNFGQGFYDNVVAVDPTDNTHAVFAGITLLTTANGGASFVDAGQEYKPNVGILHPDFHAVAFTGHDHFYLGSDGGMYKTTNFGGTGTGGDWLNLNATLGTLQFYSGTALDTQHVLGGAQDNGSAGLFVTGGYAPAPLPNWQEFLDGDGTYTAIDPNTTSTTMWAAYPNLGIFKGSYANPAATFGSAFSPASPCYFNADAACNEPTDFVAPFLVDKTGAGPQRPLLAGTNHVWYSGTGGVPAGSTALGGSWSEISGDLTAGTLASGLKDRLQTMALTPTGVTGPIMTGSRFGKVWRSTNNGAVPTTLQWVDVTGALPAYPGFNPSPGQPTAVDVNGWITGVAMNPAANSKEAWVTIGGLNVAHVWHTLDATASPVSWASVDGTGATTVPNVAVNDVAVDGISGNLYIGTDYGVLVCPVASCGGASPAPSWSTYGTGLPNAKVNAINFTQNHELVAWTHGRGAWIVPAAPLLTVTPPSVQLSCVAGSAPAGQTQVITLKNQGTGTLTFSLSTGLGWPSVTPNSGTLTAGQSAPVTVSANPCPPTPGNYSSVIQVSGTQSWTIPVSLNVTMPGQYIPITPVRILDTRLSHQTMGPNATLDVPVAGQGGLPASGISAVVLNVTVTNSTSGSYLTVYPTGVSRPLASNLNWPAGQTIPNLVEVALGSGGNVTIYNAFGTVDVLFDVQGYVSNPGGTVGLYNPVVPVRIMDTRTGLGGSTKLGPNTTVTLQVANNGGVPATGASAVTVNVTITNATSGSYLTVYPSDASSRPLASNLNFSGGQTIPNRVVVKLSASGAVSIYNAFGTVDVIVDVGGWFTDGISKTTGGKFSGLAPARIMDTRAGAGGYSLALGADKTYVLVVAGQGGVPGMDSPVPPGAVVVNITVTNTTSGGYLSVYPSDAQKPLVSDLNWTAGTTIPNLVVVKLSPDGTINIYNPSGNADVIADVVGWYN